MEGVDEKIRLTIEGEIARDLIRANGVVVSLAEAKIYSALSRLFGEGEDLGRMAEVLSAMPLYSAYVGNACIYYILVPPAVFELHHMKLGGRRALGRLVRVAGKLLALWDEVANGPDSGMARSVVEFDEVERKIALLMYELFHSGELYERDPREWYHAALIKSYPFIVDEAVELGKVRRYRVGNVWISERAEAGGDVRIYSRDGGS